MKFCMVNKSTIVNTFAFHTLHRKVTLSSIITLNDGGVEKSPKYLPRQNAK